MTAQLSEAEIQKRIQKDCEMMKRIRVAITPSETDLKNVEYEKGEFTSDNAERRARQKDVIKKFLKEQRWRKKQVKKDRKRYGPLYVWSEKKKGSLKMAKQAAAAQEAMEEKAEKKARKKKKSGKAWAKVKTKGKMKGKKGKAGKRGPRVVDGKIKLLIKDNPKREGSKAFKRFALYKKHKTVASYLKAGGRRSALRYDSKHKFIKLSNVKHKEKEAMA